MLIISGLGNYLYGDTAFGDRMKYFHGENKSGPYFEGWYFKCQTRDGHSLALIPAMHIREGGQKSASIQVITEDDACWVEYPASSFTAFPDSLYIHIGGNSYSEEGLLLDIEWEELSLHGRMCIHILLTERRGSDLLILVRCWFLRSSSGSAAVQDPVMK